jgi:spermidine synthase
MNEGVLTYHSVLRPGSVLTGGRYYDVYPALPLLLPREPGTPLRVLVLGFAAGTQARALRHFHGADLRLEGVEIDPAALEAGRAHFELPAPSAELRVHAADARSWLAAAPADRVFDLVLVDCYSHEYYVPFHVATREFFAAVRERLAPGGILAFNAFAYAPDDPLLRTLARTAAAAFGSSWVAPVEGYPNWVVLASRRDADLPLLAFAEAADRAARAPAAAPARWGGFAGRPEAAEVLRTAAACLGAASPVRADPAHEILTDDRAPVERLTDRAVADYERARTEAR